MSLSITLYTSTADPKEVDKTSKLTQVGTAAITATPTNDIDILNPVVLLNYNASYLGANYAYISEFGRYYYINDEAVKPGQSITLTMSVDPLMSFKTSILGCKACVTRSESVGGPTEIPDNKLPVDPNKKEILSAKSSIITGSTSKACRYVVTVRYNTQSLV